MTGHGIETPVAQVQASADGLDADGALTKLDPNYKLLMRIGAIIQACVVIGIAFAVEAALQSRFDIPTGIIFVPVALLGAFYAFRFPAARFHSRGYQMSDDRLRVVRGVMFHSDTIVPFGRVQHIDVQQGPFERGLGIATLILHTAGSHNASVYLPGLPHDRAVEMREDIRRHIKRESL